jgi:DNA-binding LytR/AlgR family response regulator
VIGALLATQRYGLGFEALRRLPVILGCFALLAGTDRLRSKPGRCQSVPVELPFTPAMIDWVEAAANYVVLHSGSRRAIHRATMSEVEAQLADAGFVRIHRSRLVARARIARVRPHDVILTDGSSLAIGARYRHALEAEARH